MSAHDKFLIICDAGDITVLYFEHYESVADVAAGPGGGALHISTPTLSRLSFIILIEQTVFCYSY
jgi:hypothetical protein